jgi:hypothetical protein
MSRDDRPLGIAGCQSVRASEGWQQRRELDVWHAVNHGLVITDVWELLSYFMRRRRRIPFSKCGDDVEK